MHSSVIISRESPKSAKSLTTVWAASGGYAVGRARHHMSEKDGVETYDEVEEHQRVKFIICAVPPLAVEGLPGDPAGTVVGFRLV